MMALSATVSSPTEIYPLSLHDALPICAAVEDVVPGATVQRVVAAKAAQNIRLIGRARDRRETEDVAAGRSEEHTSELQSRQYLVCRLLLEKKRNSFQHCRHVNAVFAST